MKIVLGTMNFGPQLDLDASRTMVNAYLAMGGRELDTAYVYNDGTTENYLGEILPELTPSSYEIATKVHPRITGRLDRETIMMEFSESLSRMKRDSVDLLYFHFPDGRTPIDEALEKAAFWLSEQSPIVEVTNDSWETLERESLIRSQQIHKAVAGMKMTDGLAEVRIRNLIKRNDEFYGRSLALIMKELGCSYEEAAIFYDGIHDKYLEHPAGNIFQWLREAIQEALLNPKK